MKTGILLITAIITTALTAMTASAFVDVTYNFSHSDASIMAFDCLDGTCSTVRQFSGFFPEGTSTSAGRLRVRYPSTLATQFGYAVYYTSPGKAPVESKATWHSFGNDGVFNTSFNIAFTNVSTCKSTIQEFSVTNVQFPNAPVVIEMNTSLDSTAKSAFKVADNNIEYVPPELKDEFYSARTNVILEIRREGSGSLQNRQSTQLNLFAGESRKVSFSWTPQVAGNYSTTIKTQVVDDQCDQKIDMQSTKDFTVFETLPVNECYTVLNNLTAVNERPEIDSRVTLRFLKLSNFNPSLNTFNPLTLTPVPTRLNYEIKGPDNSTVLNITTTAGANGNSVNPVPIAFSFIPTMLGMHIVKVTGIAQSPLCDGLRNTPDSISTEVFVQQRAEEQMFNITFQVNDAVGGFAVQGATVAIAGIQDQTEADGRIAFSGFRPGDYSWTITNNGYFPANGVAQVRDADIMVFVVLVPISVTPGNGTNVTPVPNATQPVVTRKKALVEEPEERIFVNSIAIPQADDARPGDNIEIIASFENEGEVELEDVKVNAIIQELGTKASAGPMDIETGDKETMKLLLWIPDDAKPGTYPARISVGTGSTRRILYRDVTVR